jgi:riboflavin kinase/FMN adenylyltransferase
VESFVSPVSDDPRGAAVAIGNFDGVHVGHLLLIARAVAAAESRRLRSVVLTFDRHPATVVRPDRAPLLLTSVEDKLALLGDTGVDDVVVLRFDAARAAESAEDFVKTVLVGTLRAEVVVVGTSFRFGHDQGGDVGLLEMGGDLGFVVDAVDLVPASLMGDGEVSSSRIRDLVAAGRVDDAAVLLSRPHEVRAEVVTSRPLAGTAGSGVWTSEELALVPEAGIILPPNGRYRVEVAPEPIALHRPSEPVARRVEARPFDVGARSAAGRGADGWSATLSVPPGSAKVPVLLLSLDGPQRTEGTVVREGDRVVVRFLRALAGEGQLGARGR